MEADIQRLMSLADCSYEEAEKFLIEANGDPVEALSLKMGVRVKRRRLNETQEFFANLRTNMEKLEDSIQAGYSKTDQSDSLEQVEKQIPHEEMVQQNNCYQECQIPSQELKVEIPEIAYQSPSGYFYDSQLSDQKLT